MFKHYQKLSGKTNAWRPRLEILEDRLVPATRTWDGGALSNNWSYSSNWVGNIAPIAGDDLVFPAGNFDKTADNDYAPGTHFRSITLGGGYTLKGNRVFLGVGGVIDNSGTSNFIKNDLDVGTAGIGLRTVQVGGGSTLFIDGEISGGNGLIKAGTGNLSLRANNSYGSLTDIQAGQLFVEKDAGLGSAGVGTQIRTGAALVANDQALGVLRLDEPLTLQVGATLRALNDVEQRGNMNLLGDITVRQESAVGLDKLRIEGVISGVGGMTIVANSRVWLTGNVGNTYQGTTRLFGDLRLDREGTAVGGALVVENGGEVRLKRGEQLSNNAEVTVNAGGILFLNAHAETIGSLALNGGELFGMMETFWGTVLDATDTDYDLANLTIRGQLTAISTSTSQSATLGGVELFFQGTASLIQVADGPAINDLIINASVLPNIAFKTGVGTLLDTTDIRPINKLNADFSVDNQLFVNEGRVRFENRQRFTEVIVNAGGRFASGSGSEIKSLTVRDGGRVRPSFDNGTGVMKIKQDLTLDPGAIVEAVFNGGNAGSQHDQFDVEGTVDIDGAILEASLGANVAVGQTYKLINNNAGDAILGAFFLPPLTSPFLLASPTGQRLAFNYAGGMLNNDLVLTLSNTPPKPPIWL